MRPCFSSSTAGTTHRSSRPDGSSKSLLTQTLIIHIIRTARIPFIESRASPALITTTIIICVVGITLPFTWAGGALGFVPLPWLYWPLVAAMLLSYAILTHLVKRWFVRRWGM